MLIALGAAASPARSQSNKPEPLPGTDPLTWSGDLSARMHEAALQDVDRRIATSPQAREALWHTDTSSPEAYEKSLQPHREHFAQIIGLADPRVPTTLERIADDTHPSPLAETDRYRIYRVRWPVLEGVHGEGLLLEPKEKQIGAVIALPDADQTPEQLAGLQAGIEPQRQWPRRLAQNGFSVVIPVLIDRGTQASGNPQIAMTNEPHREWLYRQAYMMGRHIIGYEVQKVLGLVDHFSQRSQLPIGVAGYGEGGLIAFYSAAVDSRIHAAWVSGYFKPRERTWEEPLYRNVWGLLQEFGDAEIAALIAPRGLVIEYSAEPNVTGPPTPTESQRKCAAPGRLETPAFSDVMAEYRRIAKFTPPGSKRCLIADATAPVATGSSSSLEAFAKYLEQDQLAPLTDSPIQKSLTISPQEIEARQIAQVKEIENHVQKLIRESDHVRNEAFLYKLLPQYKAEPWTLQLRFDTLPAQTFAKAAAPYKEKFWNEVIGKINDSIPPPHPLTRKIYDKPKWTGYEVVLDVGGGGFSWGILLLPKDLKEGEKRPVVVCQHGRHGLPQQVIEGDAPAYRNFAARLAEQGFITYAPHNLYQKEDYYRILSRKGNTVHLSMFSYILRHHQQILRFLDQLPNVDPTRIGFYGLSYGGETAVRVPPLLDGYCLSICSGDFNDWPRKVASTDDRHSFMFTDEWEMPYFNMGSTFSYAELTYLMVPRPFMVERGHHDGVAPDPWVAYEFAKTRWLYDQLGLGNNVAIDFFNGGHTIHSEETFPFLHKHLRWP